MKKWLAFLMAGVMICSLTACGGTSAGNAGPGSELKEEIVEAYDSWFPFGKFFHAKEGDGKLFKAEDDIDPAAAYESVEYTESMLFGRYGVHHQNDEYGIDYPSQEFCDTCEWMLPTDLQGEDAADSIGMVSTLPYSFRAGAKSFDDPVQSDTSKNWCQMSFAYKQNDTVDEEHPPQLIVVPASYTVKGNKITVQLLRDRIYSSDAGTVDIVYSGIEFTWAFELNGPTLTISDGSATSEMLAYDMLNDKNGAASGSFDWGNPVAEGSEMLDNVSKMYVKYDSASDTMDCKFTYEKPNNMGSEMVPATVCFLPDGTFRYSFYTGEEDEQELHTGELAYITCWRDGLIFTDGKNVYSYASVAASNDSSYGNLSSSNMTTEEYEKFIGLDKKRQNEIMQKRKELLNELVAAFNAAGVKAKVNMETGEIAMDADILFAVDESALSDDGKAALDGFMQAFTGVLSKPEYDNFISDVAVQGNTDTQGDYEYNKKLSKDRADSALDYCLASIEDNADLHTRFQKLMYAEGCSYDNPVYDASGNVDMAASRRVGFVFYIHIED